MTSPSHMLAVRIARELSSTANSRQHLGCRAAPYFVGIIIFLGVVLRLFIRLPTDLWEDEIIAATHTVQPTWAVIVDTIRNDIHPPLYFLQLHAWSLLAVSDLWFIANSIVWSLLGLASFYWVISNRFGKSIGLASAAVYAVMPSPVYLSDQVRMYAMLAALVIWAWYLVLKVFEDSNPRLWFCFLLTVTQCALLFTHALGALAVGCLGIYALFICWDLRRGYKKWIICYGLAAAVALPWIINAAVHGGNVESTTNGRGVAMMLSASTVGVFAQVDPIANIIGIFIFGGVVLFALREKTMARIFLCFTVVPLGAALTGTVLQPFYKFFFDHPSTLYRPDHRIWALARQAAHAGHSGDLFDFACGNLRAR